MIMHSKSQSIFSLYFCSVSAYFFQLFDCYMCIFVSLILSTVYLSFQYTFVLLGHCWLGNRLWNSSYKGKYFSTYLIYSLSMMLIVAHFTLLLYIQNAEYVLYFVFLHIMLLQLFTRQVETEKVVFPPQLVFIDFITRVKHEFHFLNIL